MNIGTAEDRSVGHESAARVPEGDKADYEIVDAHCFSAELLPRTLSACEANGGPAGATSTAGAEELTRPFIAAAAVML